uniref:Uncharacterized protein n=1 Tax=Nilaparvata lugens TaxID=108931 RepID=A0A220XIG8_NILLU|nr:hypothetical protein [Nilaparvata lugens]
MAQMSFIFVCVFVVVISFSEATPFGMFPKMAMPGFQQMGMPGFGLQSKSKSDVKSKEIKLSIPSKMPLTMPGQMPLTAGMPGSNFQSMSYSTSSHSAHVNGVPVTASQTGQVTVNDNGKVTTHVF